MGTVKDKWLFNETINPPINGMTQSVNYASYINLDGDIFTDFSQLRVRTNGHIYLGVQGLQYLVHSGTDQTNLNGWTRLVDFGSTEQEVADDFYAWFTANATLVGEEPEEEPTATVITYNGSTIATLEAGQTATIKAAEYEFDHDLVFKAGSGGAAKPILQEKTATENGEYLPDRGYDGFSKFTVDVKGSGGGEGIGANVSIKSGICPVIPTQILIEKTTINIESTGEVIE